MFWSTPGFNISGRVFENVCAHKFMLHINYFKCSQVLFDHHCVWTVGMGIDKNFTIPVPSPILLIDPIPFRFSYRFFLGEK